MKKILVYTICICMLIGALAACGASSPQKTVQLFMESWKTLDTVKMNELCESIPTDSLDAASESQNTTFYENVSYEIGEFTIDGDTATVDITITCADLAKITGDVMMEVIGQMLVHMSDDTFDQNEYVEKAMLEVINSQDCPMVTNSVTVHLKKSSDRKWIIASTEVGEANRDFYNALTGGLANIAE